MPRLPGWVLAANAKGRQPEADSPFIVQAGEDFVSHPGSPEGERRKTLCRLAGVHLARGDSEQSIEALASAWAAKCQPPFDEWEKHLAGLLRKEASSLTTPSP